MAQNVMPKVTGTVRSKNPLKGAVEILPVSSISQSVGESPELSCFLCEGVGETI